MPSPHLGREQEVEALGRKWRLSRFTRGVWARWMEWAATIIPDPLEVVKKHLKDFPPEQASRLVEIAGEKAVNYLQENSADVAALLQRVDGLGYLFYLLLRPHQPEVTLDEAFDVVVDLGLEAAARLRERAEGRVPPAEGPFRPGDEAAELRPPD